MTKRCLWCKEDPLYVRYHDEEWGCPIHDDQTLFEYLILEGMQAGLSWLTILRKRDAFREAFCAFDPHRVAQLSDRDIEKAMMNPGIIRHRGKIESTVKNAKAFLKIQEKHLSFDQYIWRFTDGKTQQNTWKNHENLPSLSSASEKMAKDLKQQGFGFVGAKICYSFMQATGMVNDHLTSCFRHAELKHH